MNMQIALETFQRILSHANVKLVMKIECHLIQEEIASNRVSVIEILLL